MANRRSDAESGLQYNRFRIYDPSIGRYISADPIGQFGLLAREGVHVSRVPVPIAGISPDLSLFQDNGYVYGLNNPVRFVDERGEIAHIVGGAIGGAAIGGAFGAAVATSRSLAIQATQSEGFSLGTTLGAAATGFVIGAAVGGATGAIGAATGFAPFLPAARAVGTSSGELFKLGVQQGFAKAKLPGLLGGIFGGVFGTADDAQAASSQVCDGGPTGGDELAGTFTGTLGALNRQ